MKKLFAMLFSMLMVATMVPTMAFAAGETVEVATGMKFKSDTTQEAIDQWADGAAVITDNGDGTYLVTLQKNITLAPGASTPIDFGDYWDEAGADQPTMILDLNGCTVSGKTIVISNSGNLIIRDSKGTGKVVYNGGAHLVAVQNCGYSLTIEGGTFECQGAGSASYNAAVSSTASSKTVIEGGTFQGNGAGALITYGDVTINGGNFHGAYGVVAKQNSSGSTGSITFPETSTAVVNAEKMAFVVQGDGTNDGTIDVNGGTFRAPAVAGKIGSANPAKDVTIAGGNYTADPSGFVADDIALIGLTSGGSTQYAVGGDVQDLAENAQVGDTVTVLNGDAITVPDKVQVENKTGNTITVNGVTVENDATVEAHVHSFGDAWKSDPDHHWHECACGEKADMASHTWGEWEVTKAATETEKGEQKHSCTVCGFTAAEEIPVLPHTHRFGTEWKSDSDHHWHECACGEKADAASHTWGEWEVTKAATETEKGEQKRSCTVCGFAATKEIPVLAHTHKFGEEWKFDKDYHWHECACGEKADTAKHTFQWVIDKEATASQKGFKHEVCSVCGYAKAAVEIPATGASNAPQTGDNSNMMVWIAVMLIAGAGAVGVIVYGKKKRSR